MSPQKKKKPLRALNCTDEEYWKAFGKEAFQLDLDIWDYDGEGNFTAQQHNWFYEGVKKERDKITDEERLLMDEEPDAPQEETPLKVVPLQESNYRDIVATLRVIADQIEKGEYGTVNDVAVVLQGNTFDVFHMGCGNVETAHLMFACAQRKMELAVVDHYEQE
jgi:hypothetical protein